jgi:hypothetical protein
MMAAAWRKAPPNFHPPSLTPASLPRPIVCRARARQGCPKNQKAFRAGFSFGVSTVDRRGHDMDLALKIARRNCQPEFSAIRFNRKMDGKTASSQRQEEAQNF